ncbi:MAG: ferrochelatase [Bacteroidales bacterium]|nr:ferrochelatase [Bacteroidales bacterium]
MANKVLLIVNTGTPDKPEVKEVRRFLSEFLNDKRVIDLPWLLRKILVNLIIVPFRAPKSTKLYKRLWTGEGSPLLNNLKKLETGIQLRLKDRYNVMGVMRYGTPSLRETLNLMKNNPPEELVVFPLFPHYASSTTGSVIELTAGIVKNWNVIPELRFVGQFYSRPEYLDAMADHIFKYDPDKYDHILFSYHGLPLRHIHSVHPERDCRDCNCGEKFPDDGAFCYKATCYETTRLLLAKLKLPSDKVSTSFQSRLTKKWLSPFTDETLIKLARSGRKRVLVIAPSFVADCLETTIEIKEEYLNLFKSEGGQELTVVESLNGSDEWAKTLIDIADI